jgi:hypothetical protein
MATAMGGFARLRESETEWGRKEEERDKREFIAYCPSMSV